MLNQTSINTFPKAVENHLLPWNPLQTFLPNYKFSTPVLSSIRCVCVCMCVGVCVCVCVCVCECQRERERGGVSLTYFFIKIWWDSLSLTFSNRYHSVYSFLPALNLNMFYLHLDSIFSDWNNMVAPHNML